MGLIKAGIGALGGVLADQWKEFIYCEALPENVLVTKGKKRMSSQGRSSNTSAEDNIITQGSRIAVADGQCMIIVEQGKVVEICSEPGEYTYDKSTEPSIFVEGFNKEGIKTIFHKMTERFQFGGDTGKDQRVYYFNTKEIMGNKYGTASAVPFRVVDTRMGLDIDIAVRCFGEYSYKLLNPILFYTNVCGNVEGEYTRDRIDGQLKSELLSALQPAFAKISEMGIRYSSVPAHAQDLGDALNEVLSEKWGNLRGIEIVSFGVSSIKASEEDEQMIKELQRNFALRDPSMAAAHLAGATATAMQGAASNPGGAMMGFMGMGMAQGATGQSMANLYAMGQQQQAAPPPPPGYGQPGGYAQAPPPQGGYAQQPAPPQAPAAPPAGAWDCSCGQRANAGNFCAGCGAKKPEPQAADGWTCPGCGTANTGKFCNDCGTKKPEPQAVEGWSCPSCGANNTGKFCNECGGKKPADAPLYRCDKCGWAPEDPKNPPKFCPECGDTFDDNDVVK